MAAARRPRSVRAPAPHLDGAASREHPRGRRDGPSPLAEARGAAGRSPRASPPWRAGGPRRRRCPGRSCRGGFRSDRRRHSRRPRLSAARRVMGQTPGYLPVALGDRLPPLLKQLRDPLALGRAARSKRSAELKPRTATADRVVKSVCPYCAVGCGQKVYVKDERVVQIEGDPDSPISRGRLCPKGAASEALVNSATRETKVKYRPPHAREWEELSLEQATEMIADRVTRPRRETWEAETDNGKPLNRTLGIHF